MTMPTLVEHLLALYQATGEREWLDQAVIYNDAMLEQFWDREQAASSSSPARNTRSC